MTIEEAQQIKKGDLIFFAGLLYEFVELKEFPHGFMIGIYDDRPRSYHIDYLNPNEVNRVYYCYACQGGGCPVCSGSGLIIG